MNTDTNLDNSKDIELSDISNNIFECSEEIELNIDSDLGDNGVIHEVPEIKDTDINFTQYSDKPNSLLEIIEIESNSSFGSPPKKIITNNISPTICQICLCLLQFTVLCGIFYLHFIDPSYRYIHNNTIVNHTGNDNIYQSNCKCSNSSTTIHHVINDSFIKEWLMDYFITNNITFKHVKADTIESELFTTGNNYINNNKANINNIFISDGSCSHMKIDNIYLNDTISFKHANISNLQADNVDITNLNVDSGGIKKLDTGDANITNLNVDSANINRGIFNDLDSTQIKNDDIISKNIITNLLYSNIHYSEVINTLVSNISNLRVDDANISNLRADDADIDTGTFNKLDSNHIKNRDMVTDNIITNILYSNIHYSEEINSQVSNIQNLNSTIINSTLGNYYTINSKYGEIDIIISNLANLTNIYVDSAVITSLISIISSINSVTSDSIYSINITSDNFKSTRIKSDELETQYIKSINISTNKLGSNIIYSLNSQIYNITNDIFNGKTINTNNIISDKFYGNHMNN